jgi:lactate dehydrogenase-like 2-hydroxyacid dehydrogenase
MGSRLDAQSFIRFRFRRHDSRILGLGKIGAAVARRAKGFNMRFSTTTGTQGIID